jgi:hypothetical protein
MHDFYSSPNIMRVIISRGDEMSGTYDMHDEKDKCSQRYGNRPLGRLGLSWVIKIDLT